MERFRFVTMPFTREIKIDHRYKVAHIEEEIMALKTAIDSRQSAVLTAPAGAGKTLVLRTLKSLLPESRYKTTYFKLTDLSSRDMCRQIAVALGTDPAWCYPTLVRAIEERLRVGFEGGGLRQVIMIDDAQELRPEVLKLIRLLTNFDMDSKLVVSIILSGQMMLKEILHRPDMEDVKQRMIRASELHLLTRDETKSYLDHRVKIAGAQRSPFEDGASDAIFEVTRGNMRAIDKIATACLIDADKAAHDTVSSSDVASARGKLWM